VHRMAAFCFMPLCSPFFEIAFVLVRLDQIASIIVNADHRIVCPAAVSSDSKGD